MNKVKNNFIKFLILSLMSCVFAVDAKPTEDTFLFCLKSSVKPLVINRTNSGLEVDNHELNEFMKKNQIVNLEEWIPQATEMDRDGDIYLNRIYRAYVSEDKRDIKSNIIYEIENLTIIKYSEEEYIRKPFYTPDDPLVELQCSLNSIKTKEAWNFWDIPNGIIPDSRHVLLASVDTGVDYTHPDIQNNAWINQGEIPIWMFEAGLDSDSDGYIEAVEVLNFLENEGMDINGDGQINLRDAVSDGSPFEDGADSDGNGYSDDILGWDNSGYFGTDDNDPFPKEDVTLDGTWAHGTHVAGILAATTDNDLGMASTAYNAKYISVKVSRENQTGEPGISDGYAGITYAAKAGYYEGTFAIINNSWGGGGYSASENATINNAQNTYGAVVLGAAGNGYDSGGEEYGSHYPSSYDNCISVCAMGCSYSWGNWATYHPTVDLAAPGENIQSAIIGSGYDAWDGSSMACPNAASAIGLLSAYHPTWNNVQLRARIEESADRKVYDENPEYETCNGNSGVDCFGAGMVDVYKAIGMDFSPKISINSYSISPNQDTDLQTLQDNDSVLNPGETAVLQVVLDNEEGWVNANSVIAVLSSSNPDLVISNDTEVFGNIANGQVSTGTFEFTVPFSVGVDNIDLTLSISANGSGGYQYSNSLNLDIDVTLFQEGFPFDTDSEIKSSPIVLDLDNDGDNEIVFADMFGRVRVIKDGIEIDNAQFPFEAGDQIWGSISSADLDNDGTPEFVVSSKDGYVYIFTLDGLQYSYNADRWLIATPVIGDIDSDPELEIVVGSYQSPTSSSPIFAINHDGTDVEGFPFVVGEKIKAGVALGDLDGNGKDDIVFGSDGDFLDVVLDNLTHAPGFPIDLGNNLRSEPAILDIGSEKIILIGCNDNNFYAINYSDASLRFVIPTGDDVYTSAAFKGSGNNTEIYFGSDDGNIYAVDINGNALDGFPYNVDGEVVGSVAIADLDNDNSLDIIAVNSTGQLYGLSDSGSLLDYFPINYGTSFASAPMVIDYDNDGDLEIVTGSSGDLMILDYKNQVNTDISSWSLFKGGYERKGFYSGEGAEPGCNQGDVNCDEILNILDIVLLVNMIMNDDPYSQIADVNLDGILNILDIVLLVNIVLAEN